MKPASGAHDALCAGDGFTSCPHRPRVDGAKDGELDQPQLKLLSDPIRLVRMVNQRLRHVSPKDLFHHPHEADGVSENDLTDVVASTPSVAPSRQAGWGRDNSQSASCAPLAKMLLGERRETTDAPSHSATEGI